MPVADRDVTALLCAHLRANIDVRVGSRVSPPRPLTFLLCRRLGGTFDWPIVDQPTIGIEAWAPAESAAHDLCWEARAHIWALRGQLLGPLTVYRVQEFAGPAWLPDPDSEQPRYVATFSIWVREALQLTEVA